MPLIGDHGRRGPDAGQLKKNLVEALLKYINNPDVTVIVQEVRARNTTLTEK